MSTDDTAETSASPQGREDLFDQYSENNSSESAVMDFVNGRTDSGILSDPTPDFPCIGSDEDMCDGDASNEDMFDGSASDGDASDEDMFDGDESEEDESDTDESNGDFSDEDMLDFYGSATHVCSGDESAGDEPDLDEPDLDEPDGDEPDGDEPDGDEPDGDEPDLDEPDGDEPDRDEPDGDEPDLDLDVSFIDTIVEDILSNNYVPLEPDAYWTFVEELCSYMTIGVKQRMEFLGVTTVSNSDIERKIQCGICLEDFCQMDKPICLPCKHLYHKQCVIPWFEQEGTCPSCRKSVDEYFRQIWMNTTGRFIYYNPEVQLCCNHSEAPSVLRKSPNHFPTSRNS